MEWWGTLLISLASAVVGGMITGVFTIFTERRKQKREDRKRLEEILEKANERKPRLEIKNYAGFGISDKIPVLRMEKPLNLLILSILGFNDSDGRLTFVYDKRALCKADYVFAEYYLINNGLTEIEEICFTSNIKKSMALFSLENGGHLVKNQVLNYDVFHNQKYIKPGERIVVRVYYLKDMIPTTTMGASELMVWLKDVNGYIWKQPLYAPLEKIGYPVMSDEREFDDARNTTKSIECFRDPRLW